MNVRSMPDEERTQITKRASIPFSFGPQRSDSRTSQVPSSANADCESVEQEPAPVHLSPFDILSSNQRQAAAKSMLADKYWNPKSWLNPRQARIRKSRRTRETG